MESRSRLVGLGGYELGPLHQPGVTYAIAGSRSGHHMHENAAAARLELAGLLDTLEGLIQLGPTSSG